MFQVGTVHIQYDMVACIIHSYKQGVLQATEQLQWIIFREDYLGSHFDIGTNQFSSSFQPQFMTAMSPSLPRETMIWW